MSFGEQGSHRCSHRNEMVIYGVALLAFSMLLGTYLGDLIGVMIGVQAKAACCGKDGRVCFTPLSRRVSVL